MRRSVFGPDAWERRETVGVCNTCLRDAETLNVLGHRPLSHGACGVSVTPVFPFTYGPSEFQGALIQTVRVLVLFCFVYATVQRTEFSATRITTCFSLNGHTIAKQTIEMDTGQWHIGWSVLV